MSWLDEGSISVLKVSAAVAEVAVTGVCVDVGGSDEVSGGCCCEGDGLRLEEVVETDVASLDSELEAGLLVDVGRSCDTDPTSVALLASTVDEETSRVAEGG